MPGLGRALGTGPVRLVPRGDRKAPLAFKQGAHPPYAIRWYGATSLFGHFRNLVATAIASESVDSRDWMRPLRAEKMNDRSPCELVARAHEASAHPPVSRCDRWRS